MHTCQGNISYLYLVLFSTCEIKINKNYLGILKKKSNNNDKNTKELLKLSNMKMKNIKIKTNSKCIKTIIVSETITL